MPTKKGPTLAQGAETIAMELDATIPFDEFVQLVLPRYESKAKNPARLVRTNLRYELPRLALVEILGKNTLGDFDDLMRQEFDLDTSDHLSQFTRVIRRGKGKYPHTTQFGELNPFEKTPARKVRLAGLGLEVGAELEYVYDFGDWLDHKLILESIGDTEKKIRYPRVVNA